MQMHRIILAGRATKDSEELESKNKKKYAKFSMAVNEYGSEKSGKEGKVYYYDAVIFGKSTGKAKELIKKGDLVLIQGKPEVEAYISKKDNEAKARVSVLVDDWTVIK